MLAVLFAVLSALSYGASDFSGAYASKDNEATVITAAMQVVSLIAIVLMVMTFAGGTYSSADLVWGALSGLAASLGLTTLYKALAIGPMSTAASITALVSAGLPVAAGIALGDVPNPLVLVGVGLAIPAAVLVAVGGLSSHEDPALTPDEQIEAQSEVNRTRAMSVLAGVGFGLFFITLSRTSPDAGLIPLIPARLASIAALSLVLTTTRLWAPIPKRWWWIVVVTGLLDSAANSLYLVALRFGSFTWVAAISSLYPVSTVLLSRVILNERLGRVQIGGLCLAAIAIVLVTIGAEL